MGSQFVVSKNGVGGYDVHARDMISVGEYTARFNHMVNECGFTPEETAQELYLMVAAFEKKTETKTATREMCETYVFNFSEPGDILSIEGRFFVVNKENCSTN